MLSSSKGFKKYILTGLSTMEVYVRVENFVRLGKNFMQLSSGLENGESGNAVITGFYRLQTNFIMEILMSKSSML